METTKYLQIAEVIEIHIQFLGRTGVQSQGIRDPDLLESAIARPQMAAYYESADIIRQATLLAVGISQTQPFVDGNKRTAFAVSQTFLRMNGVKTIGDGLDFAKQLEAVAERTGSLSDATDEFENWLRKHVTELDR